MAELGVIASVIQIVGAGTKLSIAIFDLAAAIGSAGKELHNVGTEVSLFCSVLKQVQGLLEHRHFNPSASAIELINKVIDRCQTVFEEMSDILKGLGAAAGSDVFPVFDVAFVDKAKWIFSKKNKVLMLRSTLESCKLTLSVLLNTMHLAERVSQRRQSSVTTLEEDEQDKAMTQSLLISQQYALEDLEHLEEEVENENELARSLPGVKTSLRGNNKKRRKSGGRFVQMFAGLRVVTDSTSSNEEPHNSVHLGRTSSWLASMVTVDAEIGDVHPGTLRQKRLSSVGTANAPLELLRKWTDQGGNIKSRKQAQVPTQVREVDHELWRDSKFSFESSSSATLRGIAANNTTTEQRPPVTRTTSDHISPKTGRVHSIGFHLIAGVDGALEVSHTATSTTENNDSYEAITQAVLQEHSAAIHVNQVALCIHHGGATRVLKRSEKPLDVLRQYADLGVDARLFVRRTLASGT